MMFSVVFSMVGAGVMIVALVAQQRSFVIHFDNRNLVIERHGIGSEKRWSFPVEPIKSLDMADSGMQANGRAWPELQIETTDGRIVRLLTGRMEMQIAPLAAVLHQAIFDKRISSNDSGKQ
ncbi:hypothetical protein Q31b_41850 [Novipirellula aureliae]|uniref:Uncharacterized protein n=2 Tax=Novipirellula aureliae TaxID=2527966 RepID=A0A5C6DR33_9BACT|nr:hypothetical protein Q31b_41850 [Novipirellula aureliae]